MRFGHLTDGSNSSFRLRSLEISRDFESIFSPLFDVSQIFETVSQYRVAVDREFVAHQSRRANFINAEQDFIDYKPETRKEKGGPSKAAFSAVN